jgi:hypothetical protein
MTQCCARFSEAPDFRANTVVLNILISAPWNEFDGEALMAK